MKMKIGNYYIKCLQPTKILFFLILFSSTASHAYLGPGAGISAIGSVLAFFAAILFAIIGFLWFPIKRLLKKRQNKEDTIEDQNQPPDSVELTGDNDDLG